MATEIIKLFKISVVATALLTGVLALVDTVFIATDVIEPADRLVNERVIMAIIGASIVQVGVAMVAIVYSLFPRSAGGDTASVEKSP